jgi:hypothetical protein
MPEGRAFTGAFDGGDPVVSPDGDAGRFDRIEQGAVEGGTVEMPAMAKGFAQEVAIGDPTASSPR